MRILRVLAPLVIAVAALSACAPTPQPQPTPAAATPTPTPTPTPEVTGPVLAFGGDCENVLTPQQVESILGAGALDREAWLASIESPTVAPSLNAEATLGGLECEWVASEGADLPEGMSSIAVLALPAAAVLRTDFSEPVCGPSYDAVLCRMSRTHDGVWLMARAGWYLPSPPVEQLDAALTAAAANLAAFPSPVTAPRESAWWALPSCESIAAQVRLPEFLGDNFYSGFYEGSVQPEHTLLDDAGVSRLCPWSSDSDSLTPDEEFHIVTLEIIPGGALWWSDLVTHPDASAVTVPGADAAILVGESGQDSVFATDGVNVLRASSGDGHEDDSVLVVAIAERALAALSVP